MRKVKERRKSKNKVKKGWRRKLGGIIAVILFTIVALLMFRSPKIWVGQTKLSLLVGQKNTDNILYILDPVNNTVVEIIIPSGVWVDSSRQLGMWKLGSLWQVGEDEKLGGKLIAETITKNFFIPTYAWIKTGELGLIEKEFLGKFRNIIFNRNTNLSLIDKFRVIAFLTSGTNRNKVDIKNWPLLRKTDEIERGTYKIEGDPLQYLGIYSTDTRFTSGNIKVMIVDQTQGYLDISCLTSIIEAVGAKVAYVKKDSPSDLDCVVNGDLRNVEVFKNIFGCDYLGKTSGNFDIELVFGKNFAGRF